MKEIFYSIYNLKPLHALNSVSKGEKRAGALLKIIDEEGKIGFADCFPWPELGDLSLNEQLSSLARGHPTQLTRCAIELALVDAQARAKGVSAFLCPQSIPKSHFLVNNLLACSQADVSEIIRHGYTHVKIKMGTNLEREIECLHALFDQTSLKLRLDFNERASLAAFSTILTAIAPLKEKIDFIEDPFPFDLSEWKSIQEEGWTLACDRQAPLAADQPTSARVLIIKPAILKSGEWRAWCTQTRIVTSYLGHPLGQIAAAYVAAKIDPCCSHVHGFASHHAYHPNPFSMQLNWEGPSFVLPPGNGFGFDTELNHLNWKRLEGEQK